VADGRATTRLAAVIAGLVAFALIGLPVLRLVGTALEAGPVAVASALGGPFAARAIGNSLWTAAAIAVLAVAAGTAAALVTERLAGAGRAWLRAGMLAPLLVPPFVLALGWTRAFGPRGYLDQAAGVELPGLYGPIGIVLVVAVAAAPVAYLVVAAALASRVEPDLERAARMSGAGRLVVLRTITLPLLRPALLGAAVVVFVFGLNAFGVPAVLGTPAGFSTITTRLYQDLAFSSSDAAFARATALAATLVVLALLVVGAGDAILGGRRAPRTGLPAGGDRTAGGRPAGAILGAAIVITTLLPAIALIATALTRAVGLPPVPANLTLDNFAEAIDVPTLGALGRSLALSTAAATIVVALGALVHAGVRGATGRIAGTAVTIGFAVPGSALAVAVLLAWGGVLRDTLAIILMAYVAKFWALGHRQLAGSVEALPADYLRAARASGAGPLVALRTIVVPVLWPSIAAAWFIVLIFGLHELTMSSLLYGPATSTLAVAVINVQQLGDPTVTAALAILLTGLAAVPALPLLWLRRGRGIETAGAAG